MPFVSLSYELAGAVPENVELVVAGPVRLPVVVFLVSCGVGDLVGLPVKHRVDDLLDLLFGHGVELGFEHGLIELYDFLGYGSKPLFNRGFPGESYPVRVMFSSKGSNHKVRKNSDVTLLVCEAF